MYPKCTTTWAWCHPPAHTCCTSTLCLTLLAALLSYCTAVCFRIALLWFQVSFCCCFPWMSCAAALLMANLFVAAVLIPVLLDVAFACLDHFCDRCSCNTPLPKRTVLFFIRVVISTPRAQGCAVTFMSVVWTRTPGECTRAPPDFTSPRNNCMSVLASGSHRALFLCPRPPYAQTAAHPGKCGEYRREDSECCV